MDEEKSHKDKIQGKVSWDLSNSFHLRLLIHYVGDIHQPLHASTRYTEKHPKGDEGGNLFKLKSKGEVSNLHSLWDSLLYSQTKDLQLPLSEKAWTELGSIA